MYKVTNITVHIWLTFGKLIIFIEKKKGQTMVDK